MERRGPQQRHTQREREFDRHRCLSFRHLGFRIPNCRGGDACPSSLPSCEGLALLATGSSSGRHGVGGIQFQEEDLQKKSVVYVGVDGTLAGPIYFEDQIREGARQVMESLNKICVNLYMLSGG